MTLHSINAYLDGSVKNAAALSVTANSNYPSILSVTGAAADGVAAVNGFFAVIYHEGKTEARIAGNASITNVPTIEVKTNANTEATAASIAISGGAAAVNAGVVVVVNRLESNTYVGKEVSIDSALTALTVTGTSNTDAKDTHGGLQLGGGGLRAELAHKGGRHAGDDFLVPFDGGDDLEDLALVGNGGKGAVHQTLAPAQLGQDPSDISRRLWLRRPLYRIGIR